MRYTRFKVSNFKGIRNLTLDLDDVSGARIHTLVGLNESGKTTLLEAIDYFTAGTQGISPDDLVGRIRPDENRIVPIAKRSIFNENISIQAELVLDTQDERDLRRYLMRQHKYNLSSIGPALSIRDEYRFEDSAFQSRVAYWTFRASGTVGRQIKPRLLSKQWKPDVWNSIVEFLTDRIPPIWYFPNFLFDFPDRVYLEERDNEPERRRFYRVLIADILDSLGHEGSNVEKHIVERARSDSQTEHTALEQLLLEMGRKITGEVFSAWDTIFKRKIDKAVRLSIDIDPDLGVYLRFRIEDPDGFSEIGDRSLGFRWFFIFLLLTTYRAFQRQIESVPVFLIDEPASNLHPAAQSQLLDSLERLVEKCVIIYTTHSHYLINPKWLGSTHIVQNVGLETNGDAANYSAQQTDIVVAKYRTFAAKHPDQTHYFQPILEVLDYAPSRLDLVPEVVMVEGKTDFYALKYMHDIILDSDTKLNFMPGRGAGALDDLIRMYVAWSREFVVVLDSDTEGKKQQKRYLDQIGPIIEGRVFTLSDLCDADDDARLEGMFEQADLDAIQSAIFGTGTYDKKQFSLAIQEALVTARQIPISELGRMRFKQLFSACAERIRLARGEQSGE